MGVEGGNARFGIIFSVPATCLPRHPLHSSQPTSTKLSYQPLPTLLLYLSISSYLRTLPQRGADQFPGAGSPAKCQHGPLQPLLQQQGQGSQQPGLPGLPKPAELIQQAQALQLPALPNFQQHMHQLMAAGSKRPHQDFNADNREQQQAKMSRAEQRLPPASLHRGVGA